MVAGGRDSRGRGGRDGGRGRDGGGRGRVGLGFGGGRGGRDGGRGGRDGGRGRGRGGRDGGRGGRGGRGGAAKVLVKPHFRHPGVFVGSSGKDDALLTKNFVPGISVYNEKRVSTEGADGEKVEYRNWNPFRSKLAAAIVGNLEKIHIGPGNKVLYLGAASGTTVSHVSDIVGPEGCVYAVEFSHRSGRDLVEMAKRRNNVVPIVCDARTPKAYRMLVPMVDCIFMDVAQPDQARIMALNAKMFLKVDGHYVISIKANCIDSTVEAASVFAAEVARMRADGLKPQEQVPLEPFERDHAVVVGVYRTTEK